MKPKNQERSRKAENFDKVIAALQPNTIRKKSGFTYPDRQRAGGESKPPTLPGYNEASQLAHLCGVRKGQVVARTFISAMQ